MVPYNTRSCRNIISILVILFTLFYSSNQKAYRDTYYPESPPRKKEPDAPVFRPTAKNYTVGPGDKAKLTCRVDNLGTKTVVWRRKGEKHPLTIGLYTYVPDERIDVDYNQRTNEWTLFIQHVIPKDEGYYLCTISTKEHKDRAYEVHLTVKTVQVEVIGPEVIEQGSPIMLRCNATGKPDTPRDVHWYKDNQLLTSDVARGILITKGIGVKMLISTLTIKRSQISDQGIYTCLSTNRDEAGVEIIIFDAGNNNNVRRDPLRKQEFSSGHRIGVKLTAVDRLSTIHIYYPTQLPPHNSRTGISTKYSIIPISFPVKDHGDEDPQSANIVGSGAASLTITNIFTLSLTILTSLNLLPVR